MGLCMGYWVDSNPRAERHEEMRHRRVAVRPGRFGVPSTSPSHSRQQDVVVFTLSDPSVARNSEICRSECTVARGGRKRVGARKHNNLRHVHLIFPAARSMSRRTTVAFRFTQAAHRCPPCAACSLVRGEQSTMDAIALLTRFISPQLLSFRHLCRLRAAAQTLHYGVSLREQDLSSPAHLIGSLPSGVAHQTSCLIVSLSAGIPLGPHSGGPQQGLKSLCAFDEWRINMLEESAEVLQRNHPLAPVF